MTGDALENADPRLAAGDCHEVLAGELATGVGIAAADSRGVDTGVDDGLRRPSGVAHHARHVGGTRTHTRRTS